MTTEFLDRFQLLMEELGPALGVDHATPLGETPSESWALTLGDAYVMTVRCLPEKQAVVASVTLGDVASRAHYRTLLAYNGLYEETGGVRFGLSNGEVVMTVEAPADELNLESLQTLVTNLAGTLNDWREFLHAEPGEAKSPLPAADQLATRV